MSALTPKEEKLVAQFGDRVKDLLNTEEYQQPSFLVRWIRARNHDLNQAEKMLRSSLAWRNANRMDHILELPIDNFFHREFPWEVIGTDKLDHPVFFARAGKWDYGKLDTAEKMEQFKIYMSYMSEYVAREVRHINKKRDPSLYPVTQYLHFADWTGLSYSQICNLKMIQNMLHALNLYEAHYPECLYRYISVNCPIYMNILKAVGKPIAAAKTYEKMLFYGCNRSEWEQACRQFFDEDQLNRILQRYF